MKTTTTNQLEFYPELYFQVPIKRQFVKNGEYLETLQQLKQRGVRVLTVTVKQGGYELTTK